MPHGPAAQATRAARPHVGDLYHPDLRGRGRAGAGRAAEVRGVAGLPAGALAVGALGVGDARGRCRPWPAPAARASGRPDHGPPGRASRAQPDRGPRPRPASPARAGTAPARPAAVPARTCPHSPASSRRNGLTRKKLSASDSDDDAGRSYPGSASRGRCASVRSVAAAVPGSSARASATCIASRGVIFRDRRAGTPASASSSSAGETTADASPSPVPSRTGPGSAATPAAASCSAVHAGSGAAAPGSAPHATIPEPGPGSFGQPPAGVLPDRRHRHHLGQARLRVPHRPLPAAQLPPRHLRPSLPAPAA